MFVEKLRRIEDTRSIGKPDQDAVVKTVCLQYADRMNWGNRHTGHPKRIGGSGLSPDERSARPFSRVAKGDRTPSCRKLYRAPACGAEPVGFRLISFSNRSVNGWASWRPSTYLRPRSKAAASASPSLANSCPSSPGSMGISRQFPSTNRSRKTAACQIG
jgi:hypothetical protein